MELNVKQYSHGKTLETVESEVIFGSAIGNAEPTSRLLEGSSNHGYAEEWQQESKLPNGSKCLIMYLFDTEGITDIDGEPKDPENYPWDSEHVSYVRLLD